MVVRSVVSDIVNYLNETHGKYGDGATAAGGMGSDGAAGGAATAVQQ